MFKLQIGCFIIVLFISLIYFSTKRMKTYPHILFSASLTTTAINLLFDIITVYTVNHLDTVPEWLNRACHNVFLITLFLEVFIYYLYCMSLIHEKPPGKKKAAVLSAPLILSVICVIALPLGYVEYPVTNYSYGPSVIILYIFVIGLVVIALVKMLIHFREINPKKRYVIITAMAIQFVCLIIQSIFKNILITSEGMTLINLACFLTVESPDVLLLEQLKEEKERANKANEAKSTFLAQMSHEIRTPINAVLGMNEMILRECKDPAALEYAGNAYNAGNALLSIINDILDISKIEAGKLEIVEADYELYSLVSDCCNLTADRAEKKGLDFSCTVDENLPSKLSGDMFHIRQIAVNFLTNAVKYTDEGSVTLSFSGEEKESGFALKISVKDTGTGLTEEDKEKLFTSFQRFNLKRNQSVEGTGLGLAICKQLAELMNGTVSVESDYGEGSVFSLIIPQTIVDSTPVGKTDLLHSSRAIQTQSGKTFTANDVRILVVDDVEMNLTVFRSLLKGRGLIIDTALSGKTCLEMICKQRYDIIFMDHMMPEMDGIETFGKMKETEHLNKGTPVVMLTANAISGEKEKYLSEGFVSYLTKPIQSDKLDETLIAYLPKEKITLQDKAPEKPAAYVKNGADNALIDIKLGMSYNADSEEAYREVLESYIKSGGEMLPKLRNYCTEEKWDSYVIEVHALKGMSLTIGAKALSEAAKELEFAGKNKEYDIIVRKNAALLELYENVLSEGGKILEKYAPRAPEEESAIPENITEISFEAFSEYIEKIKAACLEYDNDKISALCREGSAYSCRGTALKSIFDDIRSSAEDFECEEAANKAEAALGKLN